LKLQLPFINRINEKVEQESRSMWTIVRWLLDM